MAPQYKTRCGIVDLHGMVIDSVVEVEASSMIDDEMMERPSMTSLSGRSTPPSLIQWVFLALRIKKNSHEIFN